MARNGDKPSLRWRQYVAAALLVVGTLMYLAWAIYGLDIRPLAVAFVSTGLYFTFGDVIGGLMLRILTGMAAGFSETKDEGKGDRP